MDLTENEKFLLSLIGELVEVCTMQNEALKDLNPGGNYFEERGNNETRAASAKLDGLWKSLEAFE